MGSQGSTLHRAGHPLKNSALVSRKESPRYSELPPMSDLIDSTDVLPLRLPGRSGPRPRTVLVLGGGGMRGMAHIGVLTPWRVVGINCDMGVPMTSPGHMDRCQGST